MVEDIFTGGIMAVYAASKSAFFRTKGAKLYDEE